MLHNWVTETLCWAKLLTISCMTHVLHTVLGSAGKSVFPSIQRSWQDEKPSSPSLVYHYCWNILCKAIISERLGREHLLLFFPAAKIARQIRRRTETKSATIPSRVKITISEDENWTGLRIRCSVRVHQLLVSYSLRIPDKRMIFLF